MAYQVPPGTHLVPGPALSTALVRAPYRGGMARRRQRAPSARDRAVVAMYTRGSTMREVAEHFGISAERVRKVIRRWGKDDAVTTSLEARQAARAAARAPAAEANPGTCPVCGRPKAKEAWRTCHLPPPPGQAETCGKVWERTRRTLDPEAALRHDRNVAEWVLRNQDTVPDYRLRWAQRILGLPVTPKQGQEPDA
jgi:transposase-like protein